MRWDDDESAPADYWQALPVLGWTNDGGAVIDNGEALEVVTPRTRNVWTILPDVVLASAWDPIRRAVTWAKTGSYELPSDPIEPMFGEREAA